MSDGILGSDMRGRSDNGRWPAISLASLALGLSALIILIERSSLAGAPVVIEVFRWLGPISAGVLILLAVTAVLALMLLPEARDQAPFEEPWLPLPNVAAVHGRAAMVGLIGLENGAGSSTLAHNLAVLVATEGTCREDASPRRKPRPLCLLSEGPLTDSLGLDAKPLRQHIETHGGRVAEEVVDFAWRHPSGCELLCVPLGVIDRHRLRLLRLAVERHYDLIVVDACVKDPWLRAAAEDVSDALVLVGLPTEASFAAAASAAERLRMRHLLPRTALLLNRVHGSTTQEQLQPFGHYALVPEDPAITAIGEAQLPWALLPDSPAAFQLRSLSSQLLPDVYGVRHAA